MNLRHYPLICNFSMIVTVLGCAQTTHAQVIHIKKHRVSTEIPFTIRLGRDWKQTNLKPEDPFEDPTPELAVNFANGSKARFGVRTNSHLDKEDIDAIRANWKQNVKKHPGAKVVTKDGAEIFEFDFMYPSRSERVIKRPYYGQFYFIRSKQVCTVMYSCRSAQDIADVRQTVLTIRMDRR